MAKELNAIVIAISQNKNTFVKFRSFLISKGFTIEQVKSIEYGSTDIYIPRCIKFIEALGIDFNEAVNYFVYNSKPNSYWELITITIVGVFRMIENNNINFDLF